MIKELNRLGMIIDLSHSSHKTALDALQTSEAPVIFSHSSSFALCNSTRNVQDDVLKLVVRHRFFDIFGNFWARSVIFFIANCYLKPPPENVLMH